MRRVGLYAIILTAAALLPERGKSQTWEPFYKDSVYHFWPSVDEMWVHTFRLDSIVNGKYCNSINDAAHNWSDTCADQLYNWMGKFRKLDNSRISVTQQYSNDTEIYNFKFLSGRTWLIDKSRKLTGTVLKMTWEKLFNGVYDSVKYIEVVGPNNPSFQLLISKYNGLLTWHIYEAFWGMEYDLTRFDPPTIITKRMINDFSVGDIFYYRWYDPRSTKIKYNTRQEIGADSLYYTGENWSSYYDVKTSTSTFSHHDFEYGIGDLNSIVYRIADTLSGKKYINGELRIYPDGSVSQGPTLIRWMGSLAVQTRLPFYGILTPLYGIDDRGCYYPPFEPCYELEVYGLGKGFMRLLKECSQNPPNFYLDKMVGYFHNNKLVGQAVLGVDQITSTDFQILNPVEAILNIKTKYPLTMSGKMLDLTGKEILQIQITNGESNSDVSFIKSGVYLIKLGNQTFRILKL